MIKVGIFFGGNSREREVSFAGGRTVYDNLDKSLFEAIPIFVDSFNNFILLDWKYIYKGSIRDFYPPVKFLKESKYPIQVYAESLQSEYANNGQKMANTLGRIVKAEELTTLIDFAFLALHGSFGEDGTIQGYVQVSLVLGDYDTDAFGMAILDLVITQPKNIYLNEEIETVDIKKK